MLSLLLTYQKTKNLQILVVYDSHEPWPELMSRERFGSIHIEYAHHEKDADTRIHDLCRHQPGRYVVVSSDRAVMSNAHYYRCATLSSSEFIQKIQRALEAAQPSEPSSFDLMLEAHEEWNDDREDDRPLYPKIDTRKKGSARRRSKKERAKQKSIKKL